MTLFDKGHAFITGIANYRRVSSLPDAVLNDAADIGELLQDLTRCGYPPNQVQLLSDDRATADNIRRGFGWLAEQTGEDDTAFVFFSGHGGRIESGPQAGNYLIPVDADPIHLKDTAIESAELTELLRQIKAKRLLVLFDCCHAGGAGEVKGILDKALPDFKSGLDEAYYARLARGSGRVIIASSRSTEVSWILPGMRNSLFTHHLLEALRGQADTDGDGLIRVLNVFNFVAEEVYKHRSDQHPVLKAELEANFPIALRWGGLKTHTRDETPDEPQVSIYNPKNLTLSNEIQTILRAMFAGYKRVIIEKEFGAGLSGARVFQVYPVRQGNISELRAVVKVGSVSTVQREWQAYQNYVRDRLPDSLGMRDKPTLPPGRDWGGLRYPLAGSGRFEVESLHDYCRTADLEDVRLTLEKRLLPVLETLIRQNRVIPAFHLQSGYDRILPPNLVIQPDPVPSSAETHLIRPDKLPPVPLKKGDFVRLEGFVVTKAEARDDTVSLNLPPSTRVPPVSYSVRVKLTQAWSSFSVNHPIEAIEGRVVDTRYDRLAAEAKRALGSIFDPNRETMTLSDGTELPNPLTALPTILSEYPDVRVSAIHGDLNMQNVLVDADTHVVSLIDFALAREDHLLHDFLRLETEVVVKLIPAALATANLGPGLICSFYRLLHEVVVRGERFSPDDLPHASLEKPFTMLAAVRRMARKYLFDPDDWAEYYRCLVIYLVGALKFGNLDEMPLAKPVAFLGAGVVVELLEAPQPEPKLLFPEKTSDVFIPKSWPATLPWNEPYYQLPDRDVDIESISQNIIKKEGQWGVFISGLGGIGKTATAIEIGRRCLAARAFEQVLGDSAKLDFLVDGRVAQADDQAILDFEGFLNELGTQLDRPDIRTKPLREKQHILKGLLGRLPYLIVVDNLETLQNATQIVRDLPQLLGRSRAVITSRKVVSTNAFFLKLEGLSEADSLFFLREDAQVRQCDDITKSPDSILREIHQAVGGQPLALKLIVGQAANFGLDFALTNVQSLQDDFYRFIYWDSWQQLSLTAQQILIYLGGSPASVPLKELLYGPFDAETDNDLMTAIEQLINLSLINVIRVGNDRRYSIHEITRRFVNSDLPKLWGQHEAN